MSTPLQLGNIIIIGMRTLSRPWRQQRVQQRTHGSLVLRLVVAIAVDDTRSPPTICWSAAPVTSRTGIIIIIYISRTAAGRRYN